jgi:hypothetical protein
LGIYNLSASTGIFLWKNFVQWKNFIKMEMALLGFAGWGTGVLCIYLIGTEAQCTAKW